MQLSRTSSPGRGSGESARWRLRAGAIAALLTLWQGAARADDRVDFTTTWFQENRRGGLGGLTVIHPQLDLGVDIGEHATLGAGYSADVVTGATAAVYSTDAVSTATTFEDFRNEGRVSLGFSGSRSALVLSGGVGVERDYASITVGADGNVDLPGKNTNLALSYTHNFDQVCDKSNAAATPLERRVLTGFDECFKQYGVMGLDSADQADDLNGNGTIEELEDPVQTVWRDVSIDTVQATLTQTLSPTLVGQLSAYGQVLRGFQSNPYRRVRVGMVEPQEAVPDVRGRLAVLARVNQFLPAIRAAVHGSVRGYSDTWGVLSGTAELAYSQYAGENFLLRLRARVYQQTEAVFFKDAFFYQTESTAGAFFTGDRELGRLRHVLVGAKMSFVDTAADDEPIWGAFDRLQLNLKADVLLLDELAADDAARNLTGIGDQFLSSGQFLDAFVVQLGLLLAY